MKQKEEKKEEKKVQRTISITAATWEYLDTIKKGVKATTGMDIPNSVVMETAVRELDKSLQRKAKKTTKEEQNV